MMRRHPFDPWSFVPGILFGAFAGVVLFSSVDVTDWHVSWIAPAVFIAAGLALLIGARRPREERVQVEPPPPELEAEPESEHPRELEDD